jgi:2-dehydro-3-deoxyglucarate aldolase
MIPANPVKRKLKKGMVSLGTWNLIGHPLVTEILANAGYEWITLDLEHGTIPFSDLAAYCQLLEGKGVLPLCRLPGLQPEYFKWALDAGAMGVIVPMIKNPQDALDSVRYAKYPPQGERGTALTRVHAFGDTFDEYMALANQETMLVLMIEHIDAIHHINAIAAVDGVDALFIGPYDLSSSMNLTGQLNHPHVETACDQVLKTARSHGLAAGIHLVDPTPEDIAIRIRQGYTMIALGMDVVMLRKSSQAPLA